MKLLPDPPPRATVPLPGQSQITNPDPPDPSAPYRGWYPRWWLLSAIFCSIFIALFTLFQPYICSLRTSLAPLCQMNTWNDWREYVVVAGIWAVYLIGWLLGLLFGFSTIEVTQPHRSAIASILRSMSEFKTIYEPIYIVGTLAFFTIVVCWYFNWYQPVVFAYSSIVVFVAADCFMYRSDPLDRRLYLIGAGIFALLCAIVMIWLGPLQPVILSTEIAIAVNGIWRIFRRPLPLAQNAKLTPQQILTAEHARAIAPDAVFMALIYSIFRPNRNQNQPNQSNQMNQSIQPTQPIQPNQPTQPLGGP